MRIPYKYCLFLLLGSFPIFLSAQKTDELIPWSNSYRLSWSDYKAKPDPVSDAAASTTSYLGIDYSFSNDRVNYKITCSFSKNKSWGKYQTEHILGHEQGHFDITEIFARKLNQRMAKYVFNRSTYEKDLKKIYDDILSEKDELQTAYDNETDYSRNKPQQAAWQEKIKKILEDLKDFSDYR